jgi:hypothetical protein
VVGLALVLSHAPFWAFYVSPVLMAPLVIRELRALDVLDSSGAAALAREPPANAMLPKQKPKLLPLPKQGRYKGRKRVTTKPRGVSAKARKVRNARAKSREIRVEPTGSGKGTWLVRISGSESIALGRFGSRREALKAAYGYLLERGGGQLLSLAEGPKSHQLRVRAGRESGRSFEEFLEQTECEARADPRL